VKRAVTAMVLVAEGVAGGARVAELSASSSSCTAVQPFIEQQQRAGRPPPRAAAAARPPPRGRREKVCSCFYLEISPGAAD
jgi:hypothetical protein